MLGGYSLCTFVFFMTEAAETWAQMMSGTPFMGDPRMGNQIIGNQVIGNPNMGNPRFDNSRLGDRRMGDMRMGDPRLGDPRMDPRLGDSRMGSPIMGNQRLGDPRMNNPTWSNQVISNPSMGNANMGDPRMGDPRLGDPRTANPSMWSQNTGKPSYVAIARLRIADNTESAIGNIHFIQFTAGSPVMAVGMLQLPSNIPRDQFLALHIHEFGDVSDNCKWVGAHFNPRGQNHGGPFDYVRHDGDLGNVGSMGDMLMINITNYQLELTGLNTIIGRSLVLHIQRDDYGRAGTKESLTDGNSGYPLACGVIGVKTTFSPGTATALVPSSLLVYTCCLLCAIFMRLV